MTARVVQLGGLAAFAASCGGSRPTGGLDAPETVVLVVLDTVRADHLSACGYARPTSPFLASLAKTGAFRCDMVAPASWTLPSHASFFTGLTPLAHGAWFRDGGERLHKGIRVQPLAEDHDTLAEQFARAGYQTVLLSGNPILHDKSGLTQGFQVAAAETPDGRWLREGRLQRAVERSLGELDLARPLFLVVNVFEAHDPWTGAPPEVGWVTSHERVAFKPGDASSPYVRLHAGELPAGEREGYLATVTDAYDHGVSEADEVLRQIHGVLQAGRWLDRPYRLLVVADHGEMLGEHDRLRHGGNVFEPNLRVPLLWVESGERPALEGPIGGVDVYWLLREGRRGPVQPVLAFTEPAQAHPVPGTWAVARYEGSVKRVIGDAGAWSVDLSSDAAEQRPSETPLTDEDRTMLEALHRAAPPTGGADAGDDLLRDLGYVE